MSLMEVLIVVGILAVLATTILVNVAGSTPIARATGYDQDRGTIELAMLRYYTDHNPNVLPATNVGGANTGKGATSGALPGQGLFYIDFGKLLERGYLHKLPRSAGVDNYLPKPTGGLEVGRGSYSWYIEMSSTAIVVNSRPPKTAGVYP